MKTLLYCGVLSLFLLLASLLYIANELSDARRRIAELETTIPEIAEPAAPIEPPSPDISELMRLRAEVTALRAELSKVRRAPINGIAGPADSQGKAASGREPLRAGDRLFKTRTNVFLTEHDAHVRDLLNQKDAELSQWWKAFLAYAEDHDGYIPSEFEMAARYLPAGFQPSIDLGNFVRPGRQRPRPNRINLAAIKNPARTVLWKERVPLVLSDGLVCNMYLFADGSIQLFQE